MEKKQRKWLRPLCIALTGVCILSAAGYGVWTAQQKNKRYSAATYAMSTVVDQNAYGAHAESAMEAVNKAFAAFENRLSLYVDDSEISQINAASGQQPVKVSQDTFDLLTQAKQLALSSDNAFALTIAPISLAWGITTDTPRVLTQAETDALLPLVNDNSLILNADDCTAYLETAGQAIDLGGIAKGTACNVARDIYEQYGVDSALLSIGGNIYVRGTKPDGSEYRIGFRDPTQSASTSIASVTLKDTVFAVSGGYERYFEQDGVRYIHIFDPSTGRPAESDIVSVGVINEDGTVADFYSTTLFVWGKEKALDFLSNGGCGMLLDENNNLYVSKALESSFELAEDGYTVHFI